MTKFKDIQEQRETMKERMTELSADCLTFHDYKESEYAGVYDDFNF